jgi:Ca2+-transporting ATPase
MRQRAAMVMADMLRLGSQADTASITLDALNSAQAGRPTASAIARQAGLHSDGQIMNGSTLATLSDSALQARLADTDVFCRVLPQQKLRLVQAFRAQGQVVAMTGDGVNDAPALQAADIGVAMGARGTDVAREAAALVLLDDDFASLLTAVRYGRRIFANLRKAIVFVVTVHIPIVGLSLLPVLFGWPLLLMPVHILFLQLIIDPACALVFEAEPLEAGAMTTPPHRPDARLFEADLMMRGLGQGAGLLAILLGVYAWARAAALPDDSARALTFSVMVLCNLGLIFSNRRWQSSSTAGRQAANLWFSAIALGSLLLLACTLWLPAASRLFGFATPPANMLALGLVAALASLLWCGLVKRLATQAARRLRAAVQDH